MKLNSTLLLLSLASALPACAHTATPHLPGALPVDQSVVGEIPSYNVNVRLEKEGVLVYESRFILPPGVPTSVTSRPEIVMPSYNTSGDSLDLRVTSYAAFDKQFLDFSIEHFAIRGFSEAGGGQMVPTTLTFRHAGIMPADETPAPTSYVLDGVEYQLTISSSKIPL